MRREGVMLQVSLATSMTIKDTTCKNADVTDAQASVSAGN
jgi:hypothetical protein